MKIKCECHHLIVDRTDFLPFKGYIFPDKEWFNFLDVIDEAVEKSGPSPTDKEAALMKVRQMASRITKIAYQCPNCGRLYLSSGAQKLYEYKPESDSVPKTIFDT